MSSAGAILNADTVPFRWAGQLAILRVRGKGDTLVKITKVNKVNTDSEDADGGRYRAAHSFYRNAPADAVFVSSVPEGPRLTFINKGTVVKILPTSPYFKYSNGGTLLYVITSQKGDHTHNAFPLGGGTRYLPKVTSADVKVVDPRSINTVYAV